MNKNLHVFIAILLFSCNHSTTTDSVLKVPTNYFFDQAYNITGKLSKQDFYGPPNFGDTPDIDKLEHCYLITIDSNINIMSSDTVNGYNTEDKYAQSCFQIVGYDTIINGNIISYECRYLKDIPIGTVISLKGYFDTATTGHHQKSCLL